MGNAMSREYVGWQVFNTVADIDFKEKLAKVQTDRPSPRMLTRREQEYFGLTLRSLQKLMRRLHGPRYVLEHVVLNRPVPFPAEYYFENLDNWHEVKLHIIPVEIKVKKTVKEEVLGMHFFKNTSSATALYEADALYPRKEYMSVSWSEDCVPLDEVVHYSLYVDRVKHTSFNCKWGVSAEKMRQRKLVFDSKVSVTLAGGDEAQAKLCTEQVTLRADILYKVILKGSVLIGYSNDIYQDYPVDNMLANLNKEYIYYVYNSIEITYYSGDKVCITNCKTDAECKPPPAHSDGLEYKFLKLNMSPTSSDSLDAFGSERMDAPSSNSKKSDTLINKNLETDKNEDCVEDAVDFMINEQRTPERPEIITQAEVHASYDANSVKPIRVEVPAEEVCTCNNAEIEEEIQQLTEAIQPAAYYYNVDDDSDDTEDDIDEAIALHKYKLKAAKNANRGQPRAASSNIRKFFKIATNSVKNKVKQVAGSIVAFKNDVFEEIKSFGSDIAGSFSLNAIRGGYRAGRNRNKRRRESASTIFGIFTTSRVQKRRIPRNPSTRQSRRKTQMSGAKTRNGKRRAHAHLEVNNNVNIDQENLRTDVFEL